MPRGPDLYHEIIESLPDDAKAEIAAEQVTLD